MEKLLRKAIGSETEKVTGSWRLLRKEKRCDLLYSLSAVPGNKSGRMGWTRHVAVRGEQKCMQNCGGDTRIKENDL